SGPGAAGPCGCRPTVALLGSGRQTTTIAPGRGGEAMSELSRRQFLRQGAAAAGALVVGFDPATRAWATVSQPAGRLAPGFPTFDGTLRTDDAGRQAAADDFGHIVHRLPLAVLFPGSADDIAKLIRFARANGIRVAARGQGH